MYQFYPCLDYLLSRFKHKWNFGLVQMRQSCLCCIFVQSEPNFLLWIVYPFHLSCAKNILPCAWALNSRVYRSTSLIAGQLITPHSNYLLVFLLFTILCVAFFVVWHPRTRAKEQCAIFLALLRVVVMVTTVDLFTIKAVFPCQRTQ